MALSGLSTGQLGGLLLQLLRLVRPTSTSIEGPPSPPPRSGPIKNPWNSKQGSPWQQEIHNKPSSVDSNKRKRRNETRRHWYWKSKSFCYHSSLLLNCFICLELNMKSILVLYFLKYIYFYTCDIVLHINDNRIRENHILSS